MEALAVAASIAGIIQLTKYSDTLVSTLYRFADNAGSAKDDVENFAAQVESFSQTVGLAQVSLSQLCKEHTHSRVLEYVRTHKVLSTLERQSKFVREQLSDATYRIRERMESRFQLFAAIRWSFQKKSILALRPEMSILQNSLCLLSSTVQLEIASLAKDDARSSGQAKADQSQIRFLRRLIRSSLRIIDRLQSQVESHERLSSPFSSADLREQQKDLVNIARSMLEKEVIPQARQHSPTPTELSDNYTSLSSSSSSSHSSSLGGGRSGHARKFVVKAQPQPLWRKTGEDNPKALNCNTSFFGEFTSGYVKSNNGEIRLANAVISRVLDGNIISISEACKLGLIVKPQRFDETAVLDYGIGIKGERSVGKAILEWRSSRDDSIPHRPPFTVEFQVSEHCEPGLIFGRPFLSKRAQYWYKGSEWGTDSGREWNSALQQ